MISESRLHEIIIEELKDFNLSIGWVDPNSEYYERYCDHNDYGLFFEVDDNLSFHIESASDGKEINPYRPIILVVEEIDFDGWCSFRYDFNIPNFTILGDENIFREVFSVAVSDYHLQWRLQRIENKITHSSGIPKETLLSIEGSEYVDIRYNIKDWTVEVLNIKK